jgi:beta-barrel assembly-enhancing protease
VDRSDLRTVFERVARAAAQSTKLEIVRSHKRNAWTDGTTVYVTDSLVASMPEREVAAVLGHELGHVVERHIATTTAELERIHQKFTSEFPAGSLDHVIASAVVAVGLLAASGRRSRTLEHRADKWGERYARKAGYEPGAMSDALSRLPRAGKSFTHPSTSRRHEALQHTGKTLRIRIRRRR